MTSIKLLISNELKLCNVPVVLSFSTGYLKDIDEESILLNSLINLSILAKSFLLGMIAGSLVGSEDLYVFHKLSKL